MRVYSKSQGKVIEVPDGMGASGGSPAMQNQASLSQQQPSMGAMGGNQDQLKTAFLLQMLKNPKQTSQLKGIYEFMKPAEEEKEDKILERQKKIAQQEYSQIPVILSQLAEAQGQARGRVSGLGAKIKGFFGMQPDVSTYEATRKGFATPIARTLFGERGNLSNQDIERAMNMLPSATSTPEETQRLLSILQTLADAKAKSIGITSEDSSEGEWE